MRVGIRYNVLYAVGYIKGKAVAKDQVILQRLPQAPHFGELLKGSKPLTQAQPGYHYLYRVNAGGGDYTDSYGNHWEADETAQSGYLRVLVHWTDDFEGIARFLCQSASDL